jgi:hypothetical protein
MSADTSTPFQVDSAETVKINSFFTGFCCAVHVTGVFMHNRAS